MDELLAKMTPEDPRDLDGYCGFCHIGGVWSDPRPVDDPAGLLPPVAWRATLLVHIADCPWVASMRALGRPLTTYDRVAASDEARVERERCAYIVGVMSLPAVAEPVRVAMVERIRSGWAEGFCMVHAEPGPCARCDDAG